VKELKPGVSIYDLGQNMVGWCRLQVSGPAGTAVSLRHAETLKSDGSLYVDNLRSAKVTDTYILKGEGREVYEPRFTYHGFRYVEVTGYPGKPKLSAIEGRVVHDDLESAGEFACSNPLLNQIYQNIRWGVRGNYRSVPTDCPQRDERQGWLGDRSAESKGETYLFNTAALYTKWLQDMADAQKDSGSVPDVCPAYWPIYSDNVTWPSSTVIIPGELREQYGDANILGQHFDSAHHWMDYMGGFVTNGIIARDSYGDWCVPPEDPKLIHSRDPKRKTDKALLATAYFYHDARLMESYAKLLAKPEDTQHFAELAETLKGDFNKEFLREDDGQYDNGTQTSCVLPLAFGLVPDEQRSRIFQHLTDKIQRETHDHIGTGLIGGQWLMRVLSNNGRPDLCYTVAKQNTYPSWGYMVEKGATTIWELWNGDTADPAMNSGNHVMLVGDLAIWLHENLAGIKPDPDQPGFKAIIMRPEPVGDLNFVRATHRSPYGLIASEWRRDTKSFYWKVQIPVNSTATLFIPAQSEKSVKEGDRSASRAPGLNFLRMENGRAVFSAASGNYSFHSKM
jgi:alpha-L-rhamnosidase